MKSLLSRRLGNLLWLILPMLFFSFMSSLAMPSNTNPDLLQITPPGETVNFDLVISNNTNLEVAIQEEIVYDNIVIQPTTAASRILGRFTSTAECQDFLPNYSKKLSNNSAYLLGCSIQILDSPMHLLKKYPLMFPSNTLHRFARTF